ncbi:unnamed protein product [Heterosigma akashiwo]
MILSPSNLILIISLILNAVAVSNFRIDRNVVQQQHFSNFQYSSPESIELSHTIQQRVFRLIYRVRKLGVLLAIWNVFVIVLMIVFFSED